MQGILEAPHFQGKAAGQKATATIPVSMIYHRIDLRMTAGVGAAAATDVPVASWGTFIDDIRLIIDGDIIIEGKASYFADLAEYMGETLVPGVLPIFFNLPFARTIGGEDSTVWGTQGNMTSMTMEVELKSGNTIGDLIPFTVSSAFLGPLEDRRVKPWSTHLRIMRMARNFGATGQEQISEIPRGAHSLLGIDIMHADISDVEVIVGGRLIHKSDKQIRANQAKISGRVEQAGITHIDFVPQNRIDYSLGMNVGDFRLKLTHTSAPGSYDMYIKTLEL